jgi:hypothetical protein
MSENVGASSPRKPKGLHGLYRDNVPFLSSSLKMDLSEILGVKAQKGTLLSLEFGKGLLPVRKHGTPTYYTNSLSWMEGVIRLQVVA